MDHSRGYDALDLTLLLTQLQVSLAIMSEFLRLGTFPNWAHRRPLVWRFGDF